MTVNARLEIVAPAAFRLDLTVWALRRSPTNRIDAWDGVRWGRCLTVCAEPVPVVVEQIGSAQAPRLVVHCPVQLAAEAAPCAQIVGQVREILGLDTAVEAFERMAAGDAQLAPLAARFRGFRPPRLPSVFEALANAVACQQVSLASGLALLGKTAACLAAHASKATPPPFPTPAAVLGAGAQTLRELGWSQRKADYLLGCAQAVQSGALDAAALAAADDAQAVALLSRLRGIKRWSAQYVALRGLGRLAVLPVDDVGAHKHLALWLGRPRLDAAAMQTLTQRWQPYAGMVYFLLLLKRLDDQGLLGAKDSTLPRTMPTLP